MLQQLATAIMTAPFWTGVRKAWKQQNMLWKSTRLFKQSNVIQALQHGSHAAICRVRAMAEMVTTA
jgi:hypothetical protein